LLIKIKKGNFFLEKYFIYVVINIFILEVLLNMVSQVSSTAHAHHIAAPSESVASRRTAPAYYRRNEELDADIVEISSKNKNDDGEKGFIGKTIDTIGNAASKFVEITANAFSRAAADAVVDKAIGKLAGK